MTAPTIFRTAAEVRRFSAELHRAGKTLALVPTMGFLHEGHVSLMREGKRRADVVAASIFVNPTQFGPKEDLAKYPRDFEGDVAKCEGAGVTAVFAPEPAEMYPPGFETHVEVQGASQGLCGERRPGHFRGVATVVTKLLALFRPDIALFGEKDFQQLQVIRALNRDLSLGSEIVGMPTIREADGLAMSSRNAYLSVEDRQRSLALSRGLRAAERLVKEGKLSGSTIVEAVRHELRDAAIQEDYVELVDTQTLRPIATAVPGRSRLLIAAFLGKTRLIDNVGL